ncbi:exocyst complex component [Diplodia corticola]|uniref:Exocyst complex component n=1 Tax=Diplodia corticola TaxID=236234 RepID=A0A1J9QVM0_9PEZI|nr:exocyst complex component [Diplodia corticola]OJD32042.1 exocyst complex component [Diplodia corticola]
MNGSRSHNPNGSGSSGRPSEDGRGPRAPPPAPNNGRAEKYEDEKRRIIESCFGKTDPNGALSESYITHLRVTEDAAHPQTPPPPNSPSQNKKPRVVIISVRSTGRVRIHKARENANGSFSIGKTWHMEDLSAVESFANPAPAAPAEQQRKEWAGHTGFIVTLAKPYYWNANSAKEKDFFINSLIKIYGKYTSGKVPQLIGFSQKEMDMMLRPPAGQGPRGPPGQGPMGKLPPGSSAGPRAPPSRSGESPSRRPVASPPGDAGAPRPLQPRSRPGTAGDDRDRSGSRGPPSRGGELPPGLPNPRDPSRQPPQPRPQPSRELRKPPSREQMRPRPSQEQYRPSPPVGPPGQSPSLVPSHLTPQSSHSEFSQRPTSPIRERSPKLPLQIPQASPGRQRDYAKSPIERDAFPRSPIDRARSPIERRADDASSMDSSLLANSTFDRFGPNGARRDPSPQGLRPTTSHSTMSRSEEKMEEKPAEAPPDRKRPPMLSPLETAGLTSDAPRSPRYDDIPPALRSPRPPPSPRAPPSPRVPPSRDGPPNANIAAKENDFALEPVDPPNDIGAIESKASEPEPEPEPLRAPADPEPVPAPEEPTVEPEQEPTPEPTPESDVSEAPSPLAVRPPSRKDGESTEPEKPAVKPSLGAMIGKKKLGGALGALGAGDASIERGADGKPNMADVLRKAANAYGAFKPRAGGAAQKFKAALADAPSEQKPDGITGVFNAPSLNRQQTDDSTKAETPKDLEAPEFPAPEPASEEKVAAESVAEPDLPGLIVSAPTIGPEPTEAPTADAVSRSPSPDGKRGKSPDDIRRQRRRSNQQAKYLASLGLDATVLDIRGLEIESILSDFGWGNASMQPKKLEAFEADLKREIARVEAGSWLNNTDHNDDRVEAVEAMLDKVINECDELEGLLTLYNVELSSLNDDIAFIEAQSQGLQVQTANQKLLHSELQKLVDTISIDTRQLEPLRAATIGKPEGLEIIENSLLLLYKAMITIDPAIRQGAEVVDGASGMGNSELSNMRALQEKKQRYLQEAAIFLKRLGQHMDMTFGAALLNTRDAISRQNAGSVSTRLDPATHDFARNALWQYSPLLLFAKEIDLQTWDNLLKMYQARARPVYQEEFRDNATAWKKMARRPTGEEQDLLFTSQEKDTETLKTTARKLTVKRSGTLARGLRSNSNEKADKGGRLYPYEAFAGALDEMAPLVFTEQNFVVEFFHASSTENVDFADAVTSAPPHARKGSNLLARKMFEPDRALAKRVVEVMDDIFSFWPTELQNLVEFVVNSDPLQGVGILTCLDRKLIEYEETNQDFLTRTFQALQTRLAGLFNRFVDTQITAIEDTKVKIKKRKGVISFFKTFPHFSGAIENMIPPADDLERLEVRAMVDDAYQKINKAMFESLKVIAKESPAAMAAQSAAVGGAGTDPEDKEALNYHILHIENMNHYIEEVETHGDLVLGEWKEKARAEMNEHLALYLDAIIRRPLGKLLRRLQDFLDPIPSILGALPSGTPPSAIASRPSHSRTVFKKISASHDSKEIRKGIEALRKRVDKHFGDADDPGLSRNLVFKVLGECEKKYQDVWQQLISINNDVYGGEVDVGSWGDEIAGSFKGK